MSFLGKASFCALVLGVIWLFDGFEVLGVVGAKYEKNPAVQNFRSTGQSLWTLTKSKLEDKGLIGQKDANGTAGSEAQNLISENGEVDGVGQVIPGTQIRTELLLTVTDAGKEAEEWITKDCMPIGGVRADGRVSRRAYEDYVNDKLWLSNRNETEADPKYGINVPNPLLPYDGRLGIDNPLLPHPRFEPFGGDLNAHVSRQISNNAVCEHKSGRLVLVPEYTDGIGENGQPNDEPRLRVLVDPSGQKADIVERADDLLK